LPEGTWTVSHPFVRVRHSVKSGNFKYALAYLGELVLGSLVRDRGLDHDLGAILPVGGGGDRVLDGELERVDDAKNLVKVAA